MTCLVYIVRKGAANEELRYSLRTVVAHWPTVDRVVIVGHAPPWVTGVDVIPGNRYSAKQRNVYDNVRLAADHPGLPDEVVLMNDDFYLLRDITDPIPVWHRGLLADHIRSLGRRDTWWLRSLRATDLWLRHLGVTEPLSYELHRPLLMNREWMSKALKEAERHQPNNPPQWRTLYGNRWSIPSEQADDEKVSSTAEFPTDAEFLSTTDTSWRNSAAAAAVRDRYPDPSPFEKRSP